MAAKTLKKRAGLMSMNAKTTVMKKDAPSYKERAMAQNNKAFTKGTTKKYK